MLTGDSIIVTSHAVATLSPSREFPVAAVGVVVAVVLLLGVGGIIVWLLRRKGKIGEAVSHANVHVANEFGMAKPESEYGTVEIDQCKTGVKEFSF
jgi:hypothetical protein